MANDLRKLILSPYKRFLYLVKVLKFSRILLPLLLILYTLFINRLGFRASSIAFKRFLLLNSRNSISLEPKTSNPKRNSQSCFVKVYLD
jgi:hypothetical protein